MLFCIQSKPVFNSECYLWDFCVELNIVSRVVLDVGSQDNRH